MKTAANQAFDCLNYSFYEMNTKKNKKVSESFTYQTNGNNPDMYQKSVTPPAHIWDKIENILNEQEKQQKEDSNHVDPDLGFNGFLSIRKK